LGGFFQKGEVMNVLIERIKFVPKEIPEGMINEIAESIAEQGLMQAITVRPTNALDGYELVFGEKRLRAAMKLGWTEIPCNIRDVSDLDMRAQRAHENLKRYNLPWFEQVQIIEELHAIRQEQHGAGRTGRPTEEAGKLGWGVRDTAAELGLAIGNLSEDINLARAVRLDPSLRNVKDKRTAIRLVRLAGKRIQAEVEAGLPTELEHDQVYCGDSATILKNFPASTFHACITDPPWLSFFDPALTRDERTLPVFKELYRVMRYDSFVYVVVGDEDYFYYKEELPKLGFTVSKTPLFWRKLNALSRRGVRGWEYDRDFEFILLAVKGNPVLTSSTKISSFKDFAAVPSRSLIHPNEKPIELIKNVIQDSTFEGNFIIDPFAGSGVVGLACKETKRRFILCERDEKYYKGICKRLKLD
jgi:DNA modification methylase